MTSIASQKTVEWYREKRKNPHIEKQCVKCGKTFMTYIHRIKNCSRSCAKLGDINIRQCGHCGISIRLRTSRLARFKYCSKKCSSSARVGEQSANWQGGKTEIGLRIRSSLAYKQWRTSVFERDGYACVACGDSTGGNLQADHILPQSIYPELRLVLDNGRTLCEPCHKETDTWGRKLFTYRKKLRVADKY